jgi:hypothetical protein
MLQIYRHELQQFLPSWYNGRFEYVDFCNSMQCSDDYGIRSENKLHFLYHMQLYDTTLNIMILYCIYIVFWAGGLLFTNKLHVHVAVKIQKYSVYSRRGMEGFTHIFANNPLFF